MDSRQRCGHQPRARECVEHPRCGDQGAVPDGDVAKQGDDEHETGQPPRSKATLEHLRGRQLEREQLGTRQQTGARDDQQHIERGGGNDRPDEHQPHLPW